MTLPEPRHRKESMKAFFNDEKIKEMKPFYVCKECKSHFTKEYLEEHNLSVCSVEFIPEQFCYGELQKTFLASDLENLIRERMKKFDNLTMYEGSANVYVLLELESLLAVLNPSNEKVSTP